ncbi:MAG: EFR1 family ferrodoxin [Candidatus Thorarchaeota archaeon]
MANRIFYFTGTGNSLMVARGIGKALGDTEVTPIAGYQGDSQSSSYDVLGIVFPVYWGGLPLKVSRFLPKLKEIQASFVFGVVTHAGDPEESLSQLNSELQTIGHDLQAGFLLRMPSNYIISYDAPSEGGIKRIIENADKTIPEIAENIRNRMVNFSAADYHGHSRSYQQFLDRVNTCDKNYWVNENCTECELCVRVCPVRNIQMREGRPEWQHQCELCLACINWCPERAIQYRSGTETRGRYTNPRIAVEDIEGMSKSF